MRLQVITGGQLGSEGKGAVAAHLARGQDRLLAVRVGGPNAGHTVIGRCPSNCPDGVPLDTGAPYTVVMAGKHLNSLHPWRLRQIPVAAVSNQSALLAIAAGSEIDRDVLLDEIRALDSAGYDVSDRLLIDQTATMISNADKTAELTLVREIGSTGKGIGSARASRALRVAPLAYQSDLLSPWLADTTGTIEQFLGSSLRHVVQIEGTQGYALGQHAGYYPQCTSGDCSAIDMLAMARVSPWTVLPSELEIWTVFRTFPIRVAGPSGPLHEETTWDALGLPAEQTTVTKKVRRVGAWDTALARRSMRANGAWGHGASFTGCNRVALTMLDYLLPELHGTNSLSALDADARGRLRKAVGEFTNDIGVPISLAGTGPATMIDLRNEEDF